MEQEGRTVETTTTANSQNSEAKSSDMSNNSSNNEEHTTSSTPSSEVSTLSSIGPSSALSTTESSSPFSVCSVSSVDSNTTVNLHEILATKTRNYTYPVSGFESVQGKRASMEDTHVAIDDVRWIHQELKLGETDRCGLYGVYDGHGGKEAAILVEHLLHQSIIKDPSFVENMGEALKNGFLSTDKQILEVAAKEHWSSGSTVVVNAVLNNILWTANVGDSEAVLGRRTPKGWEPILLSKKQKPSDPSEKERIKNAGGHVVFGRVMGSLAVSRALGDKDFKHPFNKGESHFVSPEPYINKLELTPEDEFLVIACDGLCYRGAVEYIANERDAGRSTTEAAKNIVKTSLDRGTLDNVTTIIVYLKDHVPLPKQKEEEEEESKSETDPEDLDVYEFLKQEGAKKMKQVANASPKARKIIHHFHLPDEEIVLEEYSCGLEQTIIYSGILLLTNNYICFHSSAFGRKTEKLVCINDIETIRKHKSMLITNAITIETLDRKKVRLLSAGRDKAFRKVLDLVNNQSDTPPTRTALPSILIEEKPVTNDSPPMASTVPGASTPAHLNAPSRTKSVSSSYMSKLRAMTQVRMNKSGDAISTSPITRANEEEQKGDGTSTVKSTSEGETPSTSKPTTLDTTTTSSQPQATETTSQEHTAQPVENQ